MLVHSPSRYLPVGGRASGEPYTYPLSTRDSFGTPWGLTEIIGVAVVLSSCIYIKTLDVIDFRLLRDLEVPSIQDRPPLVFIHQNLPSLSERVVSLTEPIFVHVDG